MAHLFEAHINVTNLDRSIAFYRDVVGLGLAHVSKERRAAFLWIGRPELSMLGLWSASESPNIMQVHVAICLELEAVLMSCAAWQSEGCERQCKSALFGGMAWGGRARRPWSIQALFLLRRLSPRDAAKDIQSTSDG